MSNTLKNIIKSVSFILILALVLAMLSWFLAPKEVDTRTGYNSDAPLGFISEPKGSIDIFLIGNSDSYAGFSPNELWNSFGYTSYVCGESKQNLNRAYELCQMIFEYQTPKLIIIETDSMFTEPEEEKDYSKDIFNFLSSTPFSVFKYHDRWKRNLPHQYLSKPVLNPHFYAKGQYLSSDIIPYKWDDYMWTSSEVIPVADGIEEIIDKIHVLCKENNAEILLMELPSASSWNYKKHNGVAKMANDKGLRFLDLNTGLDKIGIDFKSDFRDKGNHLNWIGAKKVSMYLGEYFKSYYSFNDKRNDSSYKSWDDDYVTYTKVNEQNDIEFQKIKKELSKNK